MAYQYQYVPTEPAPHAPTMHCPGCHAVHMPDDTANGSPDRMNYVPSCDTCGRIGRAAIKACAFGRSAGVCSCWRGVPCK